MKNFEYLRGRTVLITGAAGTIGRALTKALLPVAKAVRCLDHSETDLFFLHQDYGHLGQLGPQLGDVRDLDRLRFAMQGADVVFHTAALKHVGLGEYNPFEVVQTNLQGLNNIIRSSLDANISRVIFTSSDKAVNPTNVMGASKMMGERLVSAANDIRGPRPTLFSSVRFGNVIGSRGSVVPVFARQLLRGEPVTLTDEAMTRYVMTIDEAASLVIEAGAIMRGGEVFVTKMRALRIVDLAYAMADILAGGRIELGKTGLRPGEKLYEELISAEELPRALDVDRLLVVPPPPGQGLWERQSMLSGTPVTREWNSSKDKLLTRSEVRAYLEEERILEDYQRLGAPLS